MYVQVPGNDLSFSQITVSYVPINLNTLTPRKRLAIMEFQQAFYKYLNIAPIFNQTVSQRY